jgi:hypothetical protein
MPYAPSNSDSGDNGAATHIMSSWVWWSCKNVAESIQAIDVLLRTSFVFDVPARFMDNGAGNMQP